MITKSKPPRWIDEDAVIKFVRAEYEEIVKEICEFDEQAFANLPWETVPDRPVSEIYLLAEQNAIDAARRGDIQPMSNLFRLDHPMNNRRAVPPIRSNLSPVTYALVAMFLSGELNTKNGRPRGAGGAPRKSEDQRRASTPAHNAVEVLPVVEEILQRHWPDHKKDVRDRAVKIASQIAGAEESAVHSLAQRSKRDRHRLP